MNAYDIYSDWKKHKLSDPELTCELEGIADDEKEIFDRFRCDLAFGTGGLRGVIGAGTNRMNVYTVGRATQGLANCLKKQNADASDISVVIARDSRNKGELFVQRAASVLAANGIRVYVFAEVMPTPALSFAVRYFGCDAGICVTASHNPAIYNGYKVYDSEGCQIGPSMADVILEEIGKTDIFDGVLEVAYADAVADGRITVADDGMFNAFVNRVMEESLLSDDVRNGEPLKIVYTPLNGAGYRSVTTALAKESCYDVTLVKEQIAPDGNFPTCPYPNPENDEAIALALKLCAETDADIMIATDPDCDRCRAAAKKDGGYAALSGNELGILLIDYIAKRKKALGSYPTSPVAVTTIVSTVLADGVAEEHGIELRRVLTGFKYIGEQIGLLEKEGCPERYLFGFEESCGFLSGGYVRDKDGVDATVLVCEMALYYKRRGMTLHDAYDEICQKHGYFSEGLMNFEYAGADGAAKMQSILEALRAEPPKRLAGGNVIAIVDYHKPGAREGEPNADTGLPDSNVLEYRTDNGCRVIVRPSGTEPKMKAYLSASGKDRAEADARLAAVKASIPELGL